MGCRGGEVGGGGRWGGGVGGGVGGGGGGGCGFFCQAEDGIRDLVRSRGLGDVYKRQPLYRVKSWLKSAALVTEMGAFQQVSVVTMTVVVSGTSSLGSMG